MYVHMCVHICNYTYTCIAWSVISVCVYTLHVHVIVENDLSHIGYGHVVSLQSNMYTSVFAVLWKYICLCYLCTYIARSSVKCGG